MNYTGVYGEICAARYLRDHGFEILSANYRTRFGEIDIVAQKDGVLSFVEVKTRSSGMIAPPAEAVNREKQRKLSLAAAQYLQGELSDTAARFDVIEVCLDGGKLLSVHYIPNAFGSALANA